jgi:hypothetical protein
MAVLGVVLAVFAASCGGGGSSTTGLPPNTIGNGSNTVPGQNFDGPTQYGGQQQPTYPGDTSNNGGTNGDNSNITPNNPPFVFQNVFSVPITSNGTGKIVATTLTQDGTGRLGFLPGQKVAVVLVNTNPKYLDIHYDTNNQQFPVLPQSAYSFTADLVARGTSSMAPASQIQAATQQDLGSSAGYNGLVSAKGAPAQNPSVLYERAAVSQQQIPYAVAPPSKSVSTIQKGEIRTFVNVQPTIPPPPVGADPTNPQRPTDGMEYPYEYRYSQDGRLVAIGAHCLVFLSTEINNGKPDTVQYTEARLNALAQEFDTKIFPTTQAAYAPLKTYTEYNIFRDLDRSIQLDGSDFDNSDPPMLLPNKKLPGEVDTAIGNEQRMIIFLFNSGPGGGGGFYQEGLSGAAIDALTKAGRNPADFEKSGSTLYIDAANFPANDNSWTSAYSIMAHEFQHKLFADNDLPTRDLDPTSGDSYNWFNEGLSQMSIHVNGYTVNSGNIVPWAINGQLTDYLKQINLVPVPCDGTTQISNQPQYGGGFLFFLYLFEHYDPGVGNRIYAASAAGQKDYIKLIEAGAQQTYRDAGPDGVLYTADDTFQTFHDTFDELYSKYAIANFIDGIYAANDNALFDPRFHYNTIDLKGTVNLSNGTIVLPGVETGVYPNGGTYPVTAIHRDLRPYCMDYLVFTNGDSTASNVRDLSLTVYTDPDVKMFMLPVNYNSAQNAAGIVSGVTIPTN